MHNFVKFLKIKIFICRTIQNQKIRTNRIFMTTKKGHLSMSLFFMSI